MKDGPTFCERCKHKYATHKIKLVRENMASNATWLEYYAALCIDCARIACQDATLAIQRVVRGL